ncbi:hypothetical protein DVH05_014536 [Phytophthora capsici]|nr:hypothetical protein DVH05_014536 [Phytophthora capsici]
MITNKYRRIWLETPLEQSIVEGTETNRGDFGSTSDEARQLELERNRNDCTGTPSSVDGLKAGEGGRPPVDQNQRGGDEVETGEGALTEESDDNELAARRRRVTAERRHQRRLARREARRRRQNRMLTQQHAKRHKEEKLDHKTIERKKDADRALQELEERRQKRDMTPATTERQERKDPIPVKLVKRLRDRTNTASLTNNNDGEYVCSADGLPTARIRVDRAWRDIKLDSCARFTVAGTAWMQFGDRLDVEAPVDYVEGIGGFLLDVVGVWRFKFRTVFGEVYAQTRAS